MMIKGIILVLHRVRTMETGSNLSSNLQQYHIHTRYKKDTKQRQGLELEFEFEFEHEHKHEF
jgi:hypothetical protein